MRLLISILILIGFIVSGCAEKPEAELTVPALEGINILDKKAADGRLVISSKPKISEPNACILPITITNGTDLETTISMMQFTITGTGEDDSGNMFAQTVAPGDTNTAQLLFPTRQCDELLEITAPNITCVVNEADCSDEVEFEAGENLNFKRG